MTYLNDNTYLRIARYIRFICGACYILNGMNWFIKILPFPSMSDPVMPMTSNMTADFLGAMVGSGWIFTSIKTIELLTGICLVLDIFVPLMLTVSISIVSMTFFVNLSFVSMVHTWPARIINVLYFGGTLLAMQGYLMVSYFDEYRPMLRLRPVQAVPWSAPATPPPAPARASAWLRGLIGLWTGYVLIFGTVEFLWLVGMVHQWLIPWKVLGMVGIPG